MLRITIPLEVQAILYSALNNAGTRECGGVLMGEHVGVNHFAVKTLTVQKTGSIASFVRSLTGVLRALKDYYRTHKHDYERFNYLGEWHTHPLFDVQPSAKDHQTMRELAMDANVGGNFVVLLIFRLKEDLLEGSAHTYLPDGTVYRSVLDLGCQT